MGSASWFSPGVPGVLGVTTIIMTIIIIILTLHIITVRAAPISFSSNHMVVTFCILPLTPSSQHTHIPTLEGRKDGQLLNSLEVQDSQAGVSGRAVASRTALVMGEPLTPIRRGESGKAGDREGSVHHPAD